MASDFWQEHHILKSSEPRNIPSLTSLDAPLTIADDSTAILSILLKKKNDALNISLLPSPLTTLRKLQYVHYLRISADIQLKKKKNLVYRFIY